MLLYKKTLWHKSLETFQSVKTQGIIKDNNDIANLAGFSAELQRTLFNEESCPVEGMPIEVGSLDFTMARMDAFRAVCLKKKIEDRQRMNVIADFGIALQKNIFLK